MSSFKHVIYEMAAPHVARIVLDRTESRNAQNTRLLYELNEAFDRAAHDDDVRVIILAANGPHFSSGHDLREPVEEQLATTAELGVVGTTCGFGAPGAEAQMARETEIYLGLSERWRNIPKPTIAAVQGRVIMGGLMLIWPCDIIMAAEDAQFRDDAVSFGVSGVEYFAHPWELGPRKAKEMLFTGDWFSAQEAYRLGMVNHVVPVAELAARTLELAARIATKKRFVLKLAKEAVNAMEDAQGRVSAMRTAFALHQLAQAHNLTVHGMLFDPTGLTPASARAAMVTREPTKTDPTAT